MLSRAADAVYWMSRYMERAENVARFIQVNLNLTLDLPDPRHEQWAPLVATTGDAALFAKRHRTATKENVIQFLAFDEENPNAILSCLVRARENARTVREIISSEMWEQVNRTYLHVSDAYRSGHALDNPNEFFTSLKNASHLFLGITNATMSHGEAWHFVRLGRMLERADKTSRIVDVKYYILLPRPEDVGSPIDVIQWAAVLKSASALEMYRKQRRRRITPHDVADFLMLDRTFPRSVHYCVLQAEESLRAITGSQAGSFRNEAERRMGQLASDLNYATIEDVVGRGIHEYVNDLQTQLNRVGEAIHEAFFAPRPAASPWEAASPS